MSLHLTTLSDASMSRSRELCVSSAVKHGARTVREWTHEQFKATEFYRENETICSQPRGLGYWIWKPYIILDLMNNLPDGEIALYLDAGVETINNLNYIVDRMDQDIFLFGNMHEHAHWCKRDIVDEVWGGDLGHRYGTSSYGADNQGVLRCSCGEALRANQRQCSHCGRALVPGWEAFGKQVQASAIFLRVNDQTKAFVREWLDWSTFENGRLIDDSPSRAPNHPEFAENRYDQALLSTLAYREGVPLHKWAVRYDLGNGNFVDHEQGPYKDDYPCLWLHHRRRNHEWRGVL